jgi:segregation and condensation protein B
VTLETDATVPAGTPAGGAEPSLAAVLEAVLLIAEDPVPVAELAERLDRDEDEVAATLTSLASDYSEAGRGFALREVGGGWRFYTAAACAPHVERFVLAGQTARLSQAALETLAIVAYQQPVTRGRIAAVRGVNVDGVVRTLVTRKLIEEAGPDAEGGALTYRTTDHFLERMGLRDLSELPPLAPLLPADDELAELMDPTAAFAGSDAPSSTGTPTAPDAPTEQQAFHG